MKQTIDNFLRLFVLCTVGIAGGVFFCLLRLFRRIEIEGYSKAKFTPPDNGVLVVIHNHPSLWEVFALPCILFFPFYLFDKRFIPYSVPDRTNYSQLWFWFVKPFVIPMERRNKGKLLTDIRTLVKEIKKIKVLIMAPEGGRTFKGKQFKFIDKQGQIIRGSDWNEVKDSPAKIRVFERGISYLVERTAAKIVWVWIEIKKDITPNPYRFPKYPYFLWYRFWRKVRIRIGESIICQKVNAGELEDVLLKLSIAESTP